MPDQFGNPTPQDLLAQVFASRDQQMATARTPQERRLADLHSMGQALGLGFSPQMARAKDLQKAQNDVQALSKKAGESAIDFERRQLGALYNLVKDLDPETATKVVARMTELDKEIDERNRLKAQDSREAYSFEQAKNKDLATNFFQSTVYTMDPSKGLESLERHDLNKPDETQKRIAERQKEIPGLLRLSNDQVIQLFGKQAALDSKGASSGFTKNAQGKDYDSVIAQGQVLALSNRLVDLLSDPGFNPLTDFAKVDKVVNAVGQDVISMNQETALARGGEGALRDNSSFAVQGTGSWPGLASLRARGNAVAKAVSDSLFVRLAYAFAKSMDPGGRLSDKDFDMAWRMLGGDTRDPRAAAQAIGDQINTTVAMQLDALSRKYSGTGEFSDRINREIDVARGNIDSFNKRLDKLKAQNPTDRDLSGNSLSGRIKPQGAQ